MVGMGSSSSSGTPEGGTASGESIPLLRHPLLWGGIGTIALFAAVTGAIINLPDPTASKPGDKRYVGPKYTSDEAAAAAGERLARERLEKWHDEQAQKMKYHLSFDLSPEARRYAKKMLKEHQQPVVLTPEEAANARSKLSVHGRLVTDDYEESRRNQAWLPSGRMATHNAEYVKYRDPKCEDERSFLIELLTDSQLDEFMEYIERDEEDDGEYYRAETLKKNSCCCGATVINPCACMIEGVMDCSAVEPKCPCYAAENYWDIVDMPDESDEACQCGEALGGQVGYEWDDTILCQPCHRFRLDPSNPDYNAEEELVEYVPEEMIPIGTKVRSYDFWPYDKTCYKEGVIVDHAPSPSCSPDCLHYHIRTTKVVRRGKIHDSEKGEIFMTHPYADIFDQEYSGQLAPHIQIISTAFPSTSVQ